MTKKTNTHGGKRIPGPGKKLGPAKKAPEEKYKRRLISLPPEIDEKLAKVENASDLIASLLYQYFKGIGVL